MSEQELQLKRIADELDKIRWRISMGLILLYGVFLAVVFHHWI
jgi:hypothetical protein